MRADINLLTVFEAVAETRSVTLAAQQLSLSQSAVSHALNRLRDLLDDQLFIRSRKTLIPTARAIAMILPVRDALSAVKLLMADGSFDPLTSARCLRLGASDYATLTLVPQLVAKLRKAAPHLVLEIAPAAKETLVELENGVLDLSFWGTASPAGPYDTEELFREHYVGLIAADHPLVASKRKLCVSMDQYLSYPHIAVSLGDPGRNIVDQTLRGLGRTRKIVASSHSFVGNMQCLKGTDLIATLPSKLCQGDLMKGLVKFKLPVTIPDYSYSICWHRRAEADAAVQWLRKQIMS